MPAPTHEKHWICRNGRSGLSPSAGGVEALHLKTWARRHPPHRFPENVIFLGKRFPANVIQYARPKHGTSPRGAVPGRSWGAVSPVPTRESRGSEVLRGVRRDSRLAVLFVPCVQPPRQQVLRRVRRAADWCRTAPPRRRAARRGSHGPTNSGGASGPDDAGVEVRHAPDVHRSEEHTSELQSLAYLVCRLLLEKKKKKKIKTQTKQ